MDPQQVIALEQSSGRNDFAVGVAIGALAVHVYQGRASGRQLLPSVSGPSDRVTSAFKESLKMLDESELPNEEIKSRLSDAVGSGSGDAGSAATPEDTDDEDAEPNLVDELFPEESYDRGLGGKVGSVLNNPSGSIGLR